MNSLTHVPTVQIFKTYSPAKDTSFTSSSLVSRAFIFASKAHEGQLRKTGEPYFTHPLAVAQVLHEKFHDEVLTTAALLHDTVEDCSVNIEDIYKDFGDEVGFLVDALSKNLLTFYKEKTSTDFADKIERLLYAGMKDVRVFLLKIADREHNLLTLKYLKDKKQVRVAFETQAIFSPLSRLLMYKRAKSIPACTRRMNAYLERHKLFNATQLKTFLLNETFTNLPSSFFDLVYRNANAVIWRVESEKMYHKLCTLPLLKGKIEFINVKSNGKWLTADFRFNKGAVYNDKHLRIRFSSFKLK